ncbi:hypothetical protein GWP40_12310 [Treponema vincentii]|nr:hypothetical protein [Treponema vincentii]QUY18930.1 hypothetical protein GWP40_12310 [Treponema vincentii]
MLLAEYDYETDIAVQRAEEHEIAFAQGIEQSIERGFADGSHQKALETARLMKNEAFDMSMIAKLTGISKLEIEKL